jgi:hypothetical protein
MDLRDFPIEIGYLENGGNHQTTKNHPNFFNSLTAKGGHDRPLFDKLL